jgi:hypothetical protein
MGVFSDPEKARGMIKQSQLAAKDYITAPGTTMGVGSFYTPEDPAFMMDQLRMGMEGQLPSAAQMQMQAGLGSLARGMGSAALTGGSGMAGTAGLRHAAQRGSELGLESILGMGALRAQEQEAMRQQFLQMLQQRMGLEQIAAGSYQSALHRQRGQTPTGFAQGLGAVGNVAGGVGSMMGGIGALM